MRRYDDALTFNPVAFPKRGVVSFILWDEGQCAVQSTTITSEGLAWSNYTYLLHAADGTSSLEL